MEVLSSPGHRSRRIWTVAIFVLILIWSTLLLPSHHTWTSPTSLKTFNFSSSKTSAELSKSEWVQTAFNTEIDEPADISPVSDLCKRTDWRDGLVFQCTRVKGGIGNVKNIVLTCLRYAIEAGASGFIIPSIDTRNEEELIDNAFGIENFEYLLDKAYFVNAVQRACPQIHFYETLDDFEKQHAAYSNATTRGKGVGGDIIKSFTYAHPEQWKGNFEAWLEKNVTHPPSPGHPILVAIDWAMFEWPISYETVDFVKAFGQLVRNQRDAAEIAALVLYGLAEVVAQSGAKIDPKKGIQTGAFYGAHLRTDSDAALQGWQSYDVQSEHYLQHAARNNLKTVYISSGTIEHVERFKKTAMEKYGINVTYKDALLQGKDLDRLNALTWDQKGIVDYEVLLKASALGGIDMSSFSLNLGIRRHSLVIESHDTKGWEILSNNENLTISDRFSEILHDPRDYFNIWLGIWP